MIPEKKELCFAFALGFLVGPVYLLAGPAFFIQLYCVVIIVCMSLTAHWLKNLKISIKFWLLWPVIMAAGMIISLSAVKILRG